MNSSPTTRPGWPRIALWGLLVVVLLAVIVAAVLSWMAQRAAQLPPVLGEVPAFSFTDQNGETVSLEKLAGHPWIVDFIFTRCTLSCPLMTARMVDLDEKLPATGSERVELVSITVDPDYDTPGVLAEYAERYRASARWHFLTGDRKELLTLVRDGFHLAVDPEPPEGIAAQGEPIIHSTRLVLIDSQGLVRGYYDALSRADLEQLDHHVDALLRTGS